MKNIDFTQPGGFPLKQDTLSFMQDSYRELNDALISYLTQGSRFFHDRGIGNYILSGLNVEAQNGVNYITSGWIIFNGELLYFAQTLKSIVDHEGIGHHTLSTPVTFKDGSVLPVYFEKVAIAGGADAVSFNSFLRIGNLADFRPILGISLVRNIETLSPGASRSLEINVPVVNEGDVIVVSISDNPVHDDDDDTPFAPVTFGVTDWVSVRASAKTDGKVSLFFINQHPSISAFGGDIMIRIRVLK